MNFAAFFNPRSVAVVGARPEDGHVGQALMRNLLASSPREIRPVNADYAEVLGVPAFPSVTDLPGAVDLAVIAVRSDLVPGVLRECVTKGVRAAVVISAGFKEAGTEGKVLEEEISRIAAEAKLPLLGPNCLGVIDGRNGCNASFALHAPLAGTIGFISQSGAIGTAFIEWSRGAGVGISKFVSMGNEAGVSEIAMLDELGNDPDTEAILLYLEHVSDGREFLRVARTIVLEKKKPIVLLRAGRSTRGADAVMSHTGSLAPEDAVFTAACRQAGVAAVARLDELFNAAKLLSMGTDWGNKVRLAIVTNGGGPSVNAADLVELSESMELARFNEDERAALRFVLPSMAATGNPVDVIGDAGSERYRAALDIVAADEDVDAIMAIVTPQMMTNVAAIAREIVQVARRKSVISVFMGGAVAAPGVAVLKEHGLVNFDFPSDAIAALEALTPGKKTIASPRAPRTAATNVMLGFDDTRALLAQYGIAVPGVLARSRDEAMAAVDGTSGTLFAMKAVSRDVVHKTEAHAVRLGVADRDAAGRAWDDIALCVKEHAPHATLEGMLIQPMTPGREVLVGMKRDPMFGPVIVFGLGGIFVEVLRDVAMRIAPFEKDAALAMIGEISGTRYLGEFRGMEAVDKDRLAELLVAIARLAIEYPDVTAIDLNPVMASHDSVTVVDARLMMASPQAE